MMAKVKRAALYLRVSTDRQTVENQIRALTAIAERRGWQIVATYNDSGISGAKGRDKRPGLDQMLVDACKGNFDVAMVWAIDRLGRSLIDLLGVIQHLDTCRTDLFIEQQNIDTTSPMGRLMFQVCGAFAQFERAMIMSRIDAGVKRARDAGVKFGRPKIDPKTEAAIKKALAKGDKGMLRIAAEQGVGSGTVQRIKAAMKE